MAKNKKTIKTFWDLTKHPFVKKVLQDAIPILKNITVSGTIRKVYPIYKRTVNKNEAYLLDTGHTLSQLAYICQQLSHIPLYLTSFRSSKKMEEGGVTRHPHILLCVENYIIRTQSLYDRMLQLINVVFNIYNPPNEIGHSIIKDNSHVKNSGLSSSLQKLRKLTGKYYKDRLKIIHRGSYHEDALRKLERLTIVSKESNFCHFEKQELKPLSDKYVKEKAEEFGKMNTEFFVAIGNIFDYLIKRYKKQKEEDELIYGKIKVLEKKP